MKAGLIAIAALSAVAVAQPHQRHQHAKRADVVVTEIDVQTAYVTGPAVYVDQYGNRVEGPAEATSAPAPEKPSPNQPAPQQPSPQAPAPKKEEAPAPAPTPEVKKPAVAPAPAPSSSSTPSSQPAPPPSPSPAAQSPAPAAVNSPAAVVPSLPAVSIPAVSSGDSSSSSGSSGSSSSGYGVTYNAINDDKSCRTLAQVKGDIDTLSKDYGIIRTYNNGCDVVTKVLSAIGPHGMKLFAGVDDITQVESQLGAITKAVGTNWGAIHSIAIGNEGVNNKKYSVKAVSDAVDTARGILKKAGYSGKVVTVDTFIAIINNPDLCKVGDYVAANCHAFFDGGKTAQEAGSFVLSQAQRVSQACGGAKVVITESGWPWKGSSNGKAVPSKENQAAAVSSLQKSFSADLFLFNAFNDMWKDDTADTHGAEKYWGIHGDYPKSY